MADYEDTKVKDLIINNMSQEKFNELKDAGELDPTQLYCTPEEGGAALPDQTDNAGKFLTTDGTTASWGDALVNGGTGFNALAVGQGSTANSVASISFGPYALAMATYALAVGYGSIVRGAYAIQLGKGTNDSDNTFKVGNLNGNFEMMSADGTIPTDRYTITPTTAGTYVPKLTIADDGTVTREWGAESGGSGGDYLPLSGGTMTGDIIFDAFGAQNSQIPIIRNSRIGELSVSIRFDSGSYYDVCTFNILGGYLAPNADKQGGIGAVGRRWREVYTTKLNNGADLAVPTEGGTLARIEDINNIVEVLPTADNGYTTVKNFGNGYVEITGYASIGTVGAGTGSEVQIDLPAGYTMADANYWVNIAPTSETTMFDFKAEAKARSTTHFMVAYKNEDTATGLTAAGVFWEVRGMLATTEA